MSRKLSLLVLAIALAAGCKAPAQPTPSPSPARTTKPVAPAATRSVAIKVVGPGELAAGGGKILTDGGAGLIRGGQILTDGGAGLVTKSKYGLLASLDTFVPVSAAGVQAVGLDGKAYGEVLSTAEDGTAKVVGLPTGKALSIMAAFKVDGKVYRLAAALGADAFDGTLLLDPINTMVEARVRDLVGTSAATGTITNAKLKRVWAICNKAEITLKAEELEAGRAMAELTASLNRAWQAAIDAKVTSAAEKAEIKDFMAEIEAAVKEAAGAAKEAAGEAAQAADEAKKAADELKASLGG